jgi:hypothetical protein
VREHNDDHYDHQNHCLNDRPGYQQSFRRQRRREKDQAELKDQQDGQSRISNPILPGVNRLSPVIDCS